LAGIFAKLSRTFPSSVKGNIFLFLRKKSATRPDGGVFCTAIPDDQDHPYMLLNAAHFSTSERMPLLHNIRFVDAARETQHARKAL
jgi:hypothetical protein